MTPGIWGWSLGAALALILAASLWMLHPKGADVPLPQRLPEAFANNGAPLTWIVLGSSLSRGGWPAQVGAALAECSGRAVKVVQITGPGRGSDWGVAQLDQVIQAAPDLITIEFTINDADIRRGLWPSDSRDNHLTLLQGLKAALPDVRLVLLRLNRAYGLRAGLRPLQARYDAGLATVAAQTGAGLLDLRAQWGRAEAADLPDGLHPTTAASTRLTVPTLTRDLAPLFGPECQNFATIR